MSLPLWKKLTCGPAGIALLQAVPLHAQVLLVNQDNAAARQAAIRVGRGMGTGFVADHFRVGSPGETWILDAIQTWALPDPSGGPAKLGDLFERVSLFGGIESPPPAPGEAICDCHNLMVIKTATLRTGADTPDTADVHVSRSSHSALQVTFKNLNWSVPGGADLQFGVMGLGRTTAGGRKYVWYNLAGATDAAHQLKVFDEKGKLDGPYTETGSASNPNIGINVQVWGHKPASISIRSGDESIEVILHSTATLDSKRTDLASLRFGPSGAAPVLTRFEGSKSQTDLILQFRRQETGIAATALNACLDGHLQDGVPFEGCDLLKKPAK